MRNILSLPVELQLLIISNIHLNEIENFTLCCKVVHQISKKRLMEQYARKRYFSTIAVGNIGTLTWDEDQQIRGVHPLLILRDLLADPQTWLYTKTLVIGYLDGAGSSEYDDWEEGELDEAELHDVVAQFKRNTRLLRKVLEVQRFIYPERGETNLRRCPEAKRWTKTILSGDAEAAASLLIAMFPNVQKIRFVDRHRCPEDSDFLATLEDLLHASTFDKHNLTGNDFFGKLTEVGMHGMGELCGANYEVFNGFMALPSMRTIKGRVIDGSFPTRLTESSQVQSLEFHQSAIDAASFSGALCAMRGLQKLVYNFWAGAHMDKTPWEPRQIVIALETHTRKTLRHLELTTLSGHERTNLEGFEIIDFEKGEPFIGSLCAFEVLETIRLETMMLYKEIEDPESWTQEEEDVVLLEEEGRDAVEEKRMGGPDAFVEPQLLVDILPASTRRLRLVGDLSSDDATAMLENLPALNQERLPNLLSIFFEDVERSDMNEKMVRECELVGIKMKFWRPLA